ncbi:expressed unknown protein [Seminavis robusta]|uniref:Uncharacterized protein n=1 Tax=Seminavis robusta TaxID=568900 RepID=A0A9N8DPW8_9STRA|nr:expressed unknown protein [Seminavis robusta]|eukprot:Sro263_g102260.1 n/a (143) ;mRNA; f:37630-38248
MEDNDVSDSFSVATARVDNRDINRNDRPASDGRGEDARQTLKRLLEPLFNRLRPVERQLIGALLSFVVAHPEDETSRNSLFHTFSTSDEDARILDDVLAYLERNGTLELVAINLEIAFAATNLPNSRFCSDLHPTNGVAGEH